MTVRLLSAAFAMACYLSLPAAALAKGGHGGGHSSGGHGSGHASGGHASGHGGRYEFGYFQIATRQTCVQRAQGSGDGIDHMQPGAEDIAMQAARIVHTLRIVGGEAQG